MSEQVYEVNDVVEIVATGQRGLIKHIHDGFEDTIEIYLDDGYYTCVDPQHIVLIESAWR